MAQSRRPWSSLVWILAALAPFVVPSVADAQASNDEEIVFYDDYNRAIQAAKQSNKPIFLEFRCEP